MHSTKLVAVTREETHHFIACDGCKTEVDVGISAFGFPRDWMSAVRVLDEQWRPFAVCPACQDRPLSAILPEAAQPKVSHE